MENKIVILIIWFVLWLLWKLIYDWFIKKYFEWKSDEKEHDKN